MIPFIVAEMSANHLGSMERALAIVDAAADAGADAIKLQTWSPGTMCISDYTLSSGPWAGRRLRDLYEEAFTPWEWHKPIFERARERGIEPFSAAFDCAAVDFLETLGVKRHKVASFELTDIPLIKHMNSKGKPVILSAGAGNDFPDIWEAVCAAGCQATVLHCVSSYPTDASKADLPRFKRLAASLRMIPVQYPPALGISDHSLGTGVSVAAVGLGAVMVEKHLTLSRADGGPDAGFSMEPHEFRQLVSECSRAALALCNPSQQLASAHQEDLRRSLWVQRDIEEGEPLRLGDNVTTARPALGLPPSVSITGRRAARKLSAGSPLTEECML